MAGDWIKMRANLWDDPRVSRLCEMVGAKEATIVGGLYWLWASADQHSTDGLMHGLSPATVDRKTGIKGFGKALVTIGWLTEDQDGLQIARFDEHNGSSAKRRAMETKRKESSRTGTKADRVSAWIADKKRTESGQVSEEDADTLRAREEKRREEVLDIPPQEGRGVTRKARAAPLPQDFGISPGIREWAEREGFAPYLDAHLAHFLDYAAAKRPTYVDWDAAFRNAIRCDWGDVRKTAMRTPATGQAAVDAYLARFPDAAH